MENPSTLYKKVIENGPWFLQTDTDILNFHTIEKAQEYCSSNNIVEIQILLNTEEYWYLKVNNRDSPIFNELKEIEPYNENIGQITHGTSNMIIDRANVIQDFLDFTYEISSWSVTNKPKKETTVVILQ
jgi:hypothetical protein